MKRPAVVENRVTTGWAALGGGAGGLVIGLALIPLESLPGAAGWVRLALFGAAAVALAIIDLRVRLLPNRWVAAIALAAAAQVLVHTLATGELHGLIVAPIASLVTFGIYFAMGIAGWVGFGDAKFAAALALVLAVDAGMSAIWLAPTAIVVSGLARVLRRRRAVARAHGPDIALAWLLLLAIALTT